MFNKITLYLESSDDVKYKSFSNLNKIESDNLPPRIVICGQLLSVFPLKNTNLCKSKMSVEIRNLKIITIFVYDLPHRLSVSERVEF